MLPFEETGTHLSLNLLSEGDTALGAAICALAQGQELFHGFSCRS